MSDAMPAGGARLQRLFALFDAAVELPDTQRQRFIEEHTADDSSLRAELERLLQRDLKLKGSSTVSAIDRLAADLPDLIGERDWRGVQLGRYALIEEIGRGGMGRVYSASRVDGEFEQQVAVKLIARDALNPALLRRFSNERMVLAALDHPGICRLLDAGSADDGTPWVAMELVRGQPINIWCDAHRLDLEQRLRLFRDVLAATAHAHRNLVVHRDIKPSNILVDDAGKPKLLDFGIAKPLRSSTAEHSTSTAERYFTVTHAAPEQWLGGPITVACDVYALGVLLHELLAGAPPFQFHDLSPGQIEKLILQTPAPLPSRTASLAEPAAAHARRQHSSAQWRQRLRGDLDAIVERALRKDRNDRYPSVEQFDADIEAFLEQRPVAARGGQRWYRMRKFIGRHRLVLAAISAALIAAFSLVAVILIQTIEVRLERDRAEQAINFLKQAFYAADPARSSDGDVSARQIMMTARGDLESLRQTQPALYISLAAVIADVELGLGLSESAAQLAAHALFAEAGAGQAEQELRLLQARADTMAGRLESAAKALKDYREAGGEESVALLAARGALAIQQRRHEDALADLQRASAMSAERPADEAAAFRARLELASLLRILNRPEEALAILDQMLESLRRVLPTGHPNLTLTRLRRVEMLRRIDRVDEAVVEARYAVEAVAQTYGREAPVYASALNALGNAQMVLKIASDAVVVYEEAFELYRKQLGPEHATTVRTQYNLALAMAAAAPADPRSDGVFADVFTRAERALGADNPTLAFFRAGYAESLFERQRPADALRALVQISPELLATAPPAVGTLIQASAAAVCPAGTEPSSDCRTAAELLQKKSSQP